MIVYADSTVLEAVLSTEGRSIHTWPLFGGSRKVCSSALTFTQVFIAASYIAHDAEHLIEVRGRLEDLWAYINVIPLDKMCLVRAAEIGGSLLTDVMLSLHLAAAERLPQPFQFATTSPSCKIAAEVLGYDVLEIARG